MKRILIGIFILSLSIFPSMPIMHAEETSEPMESHCCHDCGEAEKHDMQDCIDAVHDILTHQGYFLSETPEKNTIQPIYWKEYILQLELINLPVSTKSQDPPFFTSHSLVGIIKITT